MIKNKKEKCNIGFTLAEVLITLGIIGVVAAITIPTLISEYQKKSVAEKYKKVYSNLINAVKLSEVDNGPVNNWDDSFTTYDSTTNIPWLNTYILPYLSIAKSCNETMNSGCWAAGNIKAPSGNNISMHPETDIHFMKYILADGTSLAFIFRYNTGVEILADIDGPNKGANKMGRDVFDFVLVNLNQLNFHMNSVTGGLYPSGSGRNISASTYSVYGCGKDVTDTNSAGIYCGQKIINDGYQLLDDYPW